MKKMSIYPFLQEINSFAIVENETFDNAKLSKITTSNNKPFKKMVDAWVEGEYDEDPEILVSEISNLLN